MAPAPGPGVEERRTLVAAIHGTPTMLVLAVAGGGNAVIPDLLDVGGASRTVLEMVVPYGHAAMEDLVGPAPDGRSIVSPEQAEAMARAALSRAETLAFEAVSIEAGSTEAGSTEARVPLVGVAITAALASDRPKQGEHRAHLAVARGAEGAAGGSVLVTHRELKLVKGQLDRVGEDRVVADAALAMIADACGVPADQSR